jgi:hypothetical protein
VQVDQSHGSLLGQKSENCFKLPKDFGKTFNLQDQEEIKNYLAKTQKLKARKASETDQFED